MNSGIFKFEMLRKFVPPRVVKRDAENEVPHDSDAQSTLVKKPCVFNTNLSKFQQSLTKTDHLPSSALVGPQDVWEQDEPSKTTVTKATDMAYFKILYVKQVSHIT